MALKRSLTDEEKYGLSQEEIKLAEKYLRKYKTAGALKELQAAKLFEMYLLGDSFTKISQNFPTYTLPQVILTAALRGWAKERESMMYTLKDRVKAKVVKSVLEQVDFLTAMLGVTNAEHLEAMVRYMQDPINNPKPELRISTVKEYKDVSETLYKLVAGASAGKGSNSPMMDALSSNAKPKALEEPKEKELSLQDLVDEEEKQ
jgi:hypothetical protein